MLVLRRRLGESIVIVDDQNQEVLAEIRLLKIEGREIQLGFTAPDDVRIYREEVYATLEEEPHVRTMEESSADTSRERPIPERPAPL